MDINLTVGIILGLGGIVVGIFPNPVRDFFIEMWKKPLQISPSSKKVFFSPDEINWNECFYIYLTNKTGHTYYDINITSEFPSIISIDIMPEQASEFSLIGSENAGLMVGSDFMVAMENKENEMRIISTVINNIGPNETKKIKIVIKKGNYYKNFKLNFKVNGFSKNPKPILNK